MSERSVASDREASLRRAEKLLRQGRLDGAIEEYVRLLEKQPRDWNSRNALGDLYVRAGQVEQAAAQFTQIADYFAQEGFLSKAIALYKKVVKIRPDDEHALLQSADINARQGLVAEAKSCLAALAEQRRRRGDRNGSNETLIRIASLDPTDLAARMSAARAAAEMGDTAGAAGRYKELSAELFGRNRASEAIDALAEAVHLDPSDAPARDSLVAAYLRRGEIDQARRYANTPAHFKGLADELSARGQEDEAVDALAEAVQRDPGNVPTRARLVRTLIACGKIERAAACLLPETVGEDPDLLLLSAEVNMRTGRTEAGRELLRTLVGLHPNRRDDLMRLGYSLADGDRDAAFECVEVATDAAIAARDWPAAVAGLEEFARHVPSYIPPLIKLVDVCVDGELEAPLAAAQATLAECYLATGRAFEARVIAEDLVTRAPGDKANIDRFRRTLVMLGEPNPDAIIADRLSLDSLVGVADLNLDVLPSETPELGAAQPEVPPFSKGIEPPEPAHPEPPSPERVVQETPVRPGAPASVETAPSSSLGASAPGPAGPLGPTPAEQAPAAAPPTAIEQKAGGKADVAATKRGAPAHPTYDLSAGAVDVNAILAGEKTPESGVPGSRDHEEIDLSGVLGDINAGQAPGEAGAPAAVPANRPPAQGRDLEEVFEEFRQEVLREHATSTAAQHYRLALTYHDMGMTDECLKALEVAARSPRYRFQAASLLGRVHRHHGRMQKAIDWFERAAETPASSAEAGRALLYELGQTLEDAGEGVRALAVYLELQADAGDYRDVGARIKRLSR